MQEPGGGAAHHRERLVKRCRRDQFEEAQGEEPELEAAVAAPPRKLEPLEHAVEDLARLQPELEHLEDSAAPSWQRWADCRLTCSLAESGHLEDSHRHLLEHRAEVDSARCLLEPVFSAEAALEDSGRFRHYLSLYHLQGEDVDVCEAAEAAEAHLRRHRRSLHRHSGCSDTADLESASQDSEEDFFLLQHSEAVASSG